MNKKLCTKRLTLEPLTLADIQAIYNIAKERQSIEDFQYVAGSVDDVKAWLEPSYHDPSNLVWVIRKQGQTIGIGLFEVCFEAEYSGLETNVCRIGYFLDFREHNQGYATEALLAVIDWLFRYTDVERIEAGVTLHNIPSYRVLEKAGFIREKIVKGNWKWYDKVYDSAYYYPFLVVIDASRNDEARDAIIGMDKRWNLFYVVFIEREDDMIRIISARKATRKEREYYEK